jgi:hypothetical protein
MVVVWSDIALTIFAGRDTGTACWFPSIALCLPLVACYADLYVSVRVAIARVAVFRAGIAYWFLSTAFDVPSVACRARFSWLSCLLAGYVDTNDASFVASIACWLLSTTLPLTFVA